MTNYITDMQAVFVTANVYGIACLAIATASEIANEHQNFSHLCLQ